MIANRRQNVILVGCGHYARHTYVPELLSSRTDVVAVVDADIEGAGDRVNQLLADLGSRVQERRFVTQQEWQNASLSTETQNWFRQIVHKLHVDAVLVISEARSHLVYTLAASNLGIPVFVEKPLVVPRLGGVQNWQELYSKFDELHECAKEATEIVVMSQRRYHRGYQFLLQELHSIVQQSLVPVTSIELSYAGGEWRLPWEFRRENHPYHRGYGILHHSAYHFVDVLARLVSLNGGLDNAPDQVEVRVDTSRLSDFLAQIPPRRHCDLLAHDASILPHVPSPAVASGEIDLWARLRFLRGRDVITTATLNVIQNSFSRRARWDSNPDTYRGNGRVKHERLVVHVGPIATCQCHSYSPGLREEPASEKNPGELEDFQVSCYRNAKAIGGEPVQTQNFGSAHERMREARACCLKSFLNGELSHSALTTHVHTNLLMALLAEALSREAVAGFDAQPTRAPWKLET